MIKVNVTWGKLKYVVECGDADNGAALKERVAALTGVPVDRQKLMAKGGWTGILKDETMLTGIKDGQQVMLMGTADVVILPAETTTFSEDRVATTVKETIMSAGLMNMGNTCYMNATLQCIRNMPELRDAMKGVSTARTNGHTAIPFVVSLRDTLCRADASKEKIAPHQFVDILRSTFPQFAQQNNHGNYLQQDADEFFTILMDSVAKGLSTVNEGIGRYMQQELEDTYACTESTDEAKTTAKDVVFKLVVNITGGTAGAGVNINNMYEGLKLALETTVERYSEALQRNALWKKTQRISKLSRYLCFQFMRFYWKRTEQNPAGVKCKINRPVTFPETIDVYDFCTEALQSKLKTNREVEDKLNEEYFSAKRSKIDSSTDTTLSSSAAAPTSDAMDEEDEDAAALRAAMALSMAPSDVDPQTVIDAVSAFDEFGLPSNFTGIYELHSLVTHKGRDADGGHYIGWVRQKPGSNYWWKYDDDKVTETTTDLVMTLRGGSGDDHINYLTFYKYREPKVFKN